MITLRNVRLIYYLYIQILKAFGKPIKNDINFIGLTASKNYLCTNAKTPVEAIETASIEAITAFEKRFRFSLS